MTEDEMITKLMTDVRRTIDGFIRDMGDAGDNASEIAAALAVAFLSRFPEDAHALSVAAIRSEIALEDEDHYNGVVAMMTNAGLTTYTVQDEDEDEDEDEKSTAN